MTVEALAHDLPLAHPLNVRTVEACARIREATGGRIDIQVFPDSQLGSDLVSLGQVRSGEIEFLSVPGLILSSVVPAASINGVGFAFGRYGQVWSAMDGKLGAFIRGEVAPLLFDPEVWCDGSSLNRSGSWVQARQVNL